MWCQFGRVPVKREESSPHEQEPASDAGLSTPEVERDLWDLDSEPDAAGGGNGSVMKPIGKLPDKRDVSRGKSSGAIMMNVLSRGRVPESNKSPIQRRELQIRPKEDLMAASPGRLEDEFHTLDEWGDAPSDHGAEWGGPEPADVEGGHEMLPDGCEPQPMAVGNPSDSTVPGIGPRGPLRLFEWIGLAALALILLGLAYGGYLLTIHSVSSRSTTRFEPNFPVRGDRVVIHSARTYWRAPKLYGDDRDRVKRGTRLIPVVELKVDGRAAIRVRIKNDRGGWVGDPLSLMVGESGVYTFTGTAGFEDIGMHAAYRIGESEAWTFEVEEADSLDAGGNEFKLLFEMRISPDKQSS